MPKVNGNAVSLITLITLLGCTLSGYIYIDSRFDLLEQEMLKVKISMADRWTSTDQKIWAGQLKIMNPAIVVPATIPH